MPGEGGPWEFPNDCKDYTVSRDFLKAFQDGDGSKLKESEKEEKLKVENFLKWLAEIGATKNETSEDKNIEFKYEYKVNTCYCKNEKDEETPCNGKTEGGKWKTIGVSKSGVATLALTIFLLAISIIGTYERVLKGYVN